MPALDAIVLNLGQCRQSVQAASSQFCRAPGTRGSSQGTGVKQDRPRQECPGSLGRRHGNGVTGVHSRP